MFVNGKHAVENGVADEGLLKGAGSDNEIKIIYDIVGVDDSARSEIRLYLLAFRFP